MEIGLEIIFKLLCVSYAVLKSICSDIECKQWRDIFFAKRCVKVNLLKTYYKFVNITTILFSESIYQVLLTLSLWGVF